MLELKKWVQSVDLISEIFLPRLQTAHLHEHQPFMLARKTELSTELEVRIVLGELGAKITFPDPDYQNEYWVDRHPLSRTKKPAASSLSEYYNSLQPNRQGLERLLIDLKKGDAGVYEVTAYITEGDPEEVLSLARRLEIVNPR